MTTGHTSRGGMRTSEHPHNRRAFPRWHTEFEVRYGNGKAMQDARGYEIGQAGVGFITHDPPALDSEIDVAYRLRPGDDWTQVKCVVRYCTGQKVGAEFLNIRRADRLRIIEFLAAHPPISE